MIILAEYKIGKIEIKQSLKVCWWMDSIKFDQLHISQVDTDFIDKINWSEYFLSEKLSKDLFSVVTM